MQTTPSRDALMQNEAGNLSTPCSVRAVRAWMWPDSFIESLHFAHAVSTVLLFWQLQRTRTRISISISAWLLFCAFAYAIKFGAGSNSYGCKAN